MYTHIIGLDEEVLQAAGRGQGVVGLSALFVFPSYFDYYVVGLFILYYLCRDCFNAYVQYLLLNKYTAYYLLFLIISSPSNQAAGRGQDVVGLSALISCIHVYVLYIMCCNVLYIMYCIVLYMMYIHLF